MTLPGWKLCSACSTALHGRFSFRCDWFKRKSQTGTKANQSASTFSQKCDKLSKNLQDAVEGRWTPHWVFSCLTIARNWMWWCYVTELHRKKSIKNKIKEGLSLAFNDGAISTILHPTVWNLHKWNTSQWHSGRPSSNVHSDHRTATWPLPPW